MAGVTHRDNVIERMPATNVAQDYKSGQGSLTGNAMSPCNTPGLSLMPGVFPANQQGCGHVKSILMGCVCTTSMTAHRGLNQRQYTQCLGGQPELEVPPGLKKGGGTGGGGIAISHCVSTEG